jgi:hypothetical protein
MAGAVNSTDDHSDASSADDARLLECVSGPDRTLRDVESAFEHAHAPGPERFRAKCALCAFISAHPPGPSPLTPEARLAALSLLAPDPRPGIRAHVAAWALAPDGRASDAERIFLAASFADDPTTTSPRPFHDRTPAETLAVLRAEPPPSSEALDAIGRVAGVVVPVASSSARTREDQKNQTQTKAKTRTRTPRLLPLPGELPSRWLDRDPSPVPRGLSGLGSGPCLDRRAGAAGGDDAKAYDALAAAVAAAVDAPLMPNRQTEIVDALRASGDGTRHARRCLRALAAAEGRGSRLRREAPSASEESVSARDDSSARESSPVGLGGVEAGGFGSFPLGSLGSLVERNPAVAAGLAARAGLRSEATGALLDLLIDPHRGPVTLHAMEVVNALANALPRGSSLDGAFARAFVANVARSCEAHEDVGARHRAARLASVFLMVLVRNGRVRAGEVAEEVARFCVQFMAVKEAADLFKLLKQKETETERQEKGGA